MRIAALIFLIFLAPALAFAGPLGDGQTAFDKGDYQTAMNLWRPLANKGNARAQSAIGRMYFWGKGVKQDISEAMKWYKKAAKHSGSEQERIGGLYFRGQGVKQDYGEALKWYRKAANSGVDSAQGKLGNFYNEGVIVKQDYQEALFWYALPKSHSLSTLIEVENTILEIKKHCTDKQIATVLNRLSKWKPTAKNHRHSPVRLYSWLDTDNKWRFRLLSGGYIGHPSVQDIFSDKNTIRSLKELERKLANIPSNTIVFWPEHLPSDRTKAAIPGSERLRFPPQDVRDQIDRVASKHLLFLDYFSY